MLEKRAPENGTTLDFYHGAYGPTIRIGIQSKRAILQLHSIFLNLADGEIWEADLRDIESVGLAGEWACVLKRVPGHDEFRQALVMEAIADQPPKFVWSQTAQGWRICAGLLDGLIDHGGPSHQYLTNEGIDDALVEVAYFEEPSIGSS